MEQPQDLLSKRFGAKRQETRNPEDANRADAATGNPFETKIATSSNHHSQNHQSQIPRSLL